MSSRVENATVDGRHARGDRTRRTILAKAVELASVNGLEGLTIGALATELGVSKSGLFAHFGSKQELQLATVDTAAELFEEAVWNPVSSIEPGLPQLVALMNSWLAYFHQDVFPGGCFFCNAQHEFDSKPGPVRDRLAEHEQRWANALVALARAARKRRELREDADPDQLGFELDAAGTLANMRWQLTRDPQALDRARTAIVRSLASSATEDGLAKLRLLGAGNASARSSAH